MFEFFSNKKEGERSVVLDIQSGLVRGAVVVKNLDSILVTSVVTKSISSKTTIKNSEHLTKRVLKLISEVTEHLSRDIGGSKVDKVEYILSSPWIISKLKTVKVDFDKETEITQSIMSDIIKKETVGKVTNTDTKAIEQKIFEIRLNGYPAVLVEGKKAHTLEVSLSTSFGSVSFLDKVHDVVVRHIRHKKSSLHSSLLLQYKALREILKDKSEFIYVHVHSELTDMIIVKDGLCKHIASFPFGIQTILRKVSSGTKETIESSDSLLSLYQGNKLSENEQIKIKKIVDPLMSDWSDQCVKSFESVFDTISTPRVMYISSHSHFDIFKNALAAAGKYNFELISYDIIDTGNEVIFSKGVAQSNMIKMYTVALNEKI
jgi:hypothetical protein